MQSATANRKLLWLEENSDYAILTAANSKSLAFEVTVLSTLEFQIISSEISKFSVVVIGFENQITRAGAIAKSLRLSGYGGLLVACSLRRPSSPEVADLHSEFDQFMARSIYREKLRSNLQKLMTV